MGISALLRNIVATDKVRELAYTGRIVSGTEAAEIGLVTSICDDPVAKARSVAAQIAGKSPDAIRAIKKLINESWQKDHTSALRHEAVLQGALMGSANQAEAVRANMENRAALFTDPES
jgi:enoyl-CoA hydratase/carnithine racemase